MKLFIVETDDVDQIVGLVRALTDRGATNILRTGSGASDLAQLWRELEQKPKPVDAPTLQPDLSLWEDDAGQDGGGLPSDSPRNVAEPTTHQHPLYQEGLNAWYGLLHTWGTNFGVEGQPQPDRAKALMDMLNFGGQAPWVYIRAFSGLTQALYALTPNWGRKKVRLVTENIVQVASALAYRELADHLEYTTPYIGWSRLPDEPAAAASEEALTVQNLPTAEE